MKHRKPILCYILLLCGGVLLSPSMMVPRAYATVAVTSEEMAEKSEWVKQNFLTASNLPPFSFTYSGSPSSGLLPTWTRSVTDTVLDTNRIQHTITWESSILKVSCVAVEYKDYPMVEWTVYLRNTGSRSTPLLANIQGLDTTFSRTNGPEFVLHGNKGDFNAADSYEPFQITLFPSSVQNYSPPSYSGKSCDGPNGWPYYNLQMPGGGVILAIGWPGQWASSFTRDAGNDLRIRAGQQLTHLILKPGEEIRTPMIAMLFWQGTNVVRAQNIWRHWYMAHEIPKINGAPPATLIAQGGDNTNVVNLFLQAGIRPDILWRDADNEPYTWYPTTNGPFTGSIAWLNTGTWEIDTNYYPNGFSRLTAALHSMGMKFLLWFEPERVGDPNSWLAVNHPGWLLHPGSDGLILNEGNPAAFNWLTNHINGMIVSNGIDWYREDLNGSGPCTSWRANDATNRQGITENFYVQGHLAYWDALLAMNPGLRIDSCASGGRRNDLESMRRAVPLHRSDFSTTPKVVDGNQCQTYGLSSWLPYQGQCCSFWDSPYSFRSFYMAAFTIGISEPIVAAQKQAYRECKKVAPIMLNGDYYPLTSYSLADNVWIAWQFDWPDKGEGCVQAFRRINSEVPAMTFKLNGLVPSKLYAVQDFDKGDLGSYSGSALMSTGLTVSLGPRQSAILYYTNMQAIKLSASGTPSGGLKPLTVQFSANGTSACSSAPLTYTWDFGDGAISTNQNPSHVYDTGGRYHARVTASDGMGNTNTMEVSVTVLNKLHALTL